VASEPTAVLLNDRPYNGQQPAVLHHSNPMLDQFNLANSQDVTIQGPSGSTATFFDNNSYQTDENYLMIVKTTDADVRLNLADDRGGQPPAQAGNGVYKGDAEGYTWILFKNVKGDFLQQAIGPFESWVATIPVIGNDLEPVVKAIEALARAVLRVDEVEWQQEPWGQFIDLHDSMDGSANYHVDNVSSILFGVGETHAL